MKTITAACVILGLMAGTAQAQMPVSDQGMEYTGTQIAFRVFVSKIDFTQQSVVIHMPDDTSKQFSYSALPCERPGTLRLIVPDIDGINAVNVFSVITSCFDRSVLEGVSK